MQKYTYFNPDIVLIENNFIYIPRCHIVHGGADLLCPSGMVWDWIYTWSMSNVQRRVRVLATKRTLGKLDYFVQGKACGKWTRGIAHRHRYSWDILYQIIILYILFTYFTVKLYVYNSNSAVSFILNNLTFSQYTTSTLFTDYIYVI